MKASHQIGERHHGESAMAGDSAAKISGMAAVSSSENKAWL